MHEEMNFELRRQLAHAATGIILALILMQIGRLNYLYFSIFVMLLMGIAIYVVQNKPHSKLSELIRSFERKEAPAFYGAFLFVVGALIAALLYPETIAIYAILLLGVADAISTIVGVARGKHKLPWNKGKSCEGSFAFLVASLAILLVSQGPLNAFVIAVILAAIESLPRINDNITIPIAAGALMLLI